MMRCLGYACLFALLALPVRAQTEPQPSAATAASDISGLKPPAAGEPSEAPTDAAAAAPADAAAATPAETAAPPPAAAAAAATAPPTDARRTLTAEERRSLMQGRQAVLRDQRFSDGPADDEPERRASDEDAIAHVTIGLSIDSVFYTDPGYDLFDDNDVASRLGIWASYDILTLGPRGVLALELGFGTESQEQAIWAGDLQSSLETQTLSAGVSVRYALTSWLDPQLRAAAGASFVAFALDDRDSTTFEDDAVSGFGSLGAGVLFHTPSRAFETRQGGFAAFQLGALIEAGYALRSPVEFALKHGSPALAIDLTEASLGQLDLAGAYVRSSLLVRF